MVSIYIYSSLKEGRSFGPQVGSGAWDFRLGVLGFLDRPHGSSFLGLPYRILDTADGQNPALPIIKNIP